MQSGRILFLAMLAASAGLVGCGGGSGGGSTGAAPTAPGSNTGTINGGITDAAVDEVDQVNLRLTAVEFRLADAGEDDFQTVDLTDDMGNAMEFNLLDYQDGEVFPLFSGEEVLAGRYEDVRLILEAPAQTPRECEGQDPLNGSHVRELTGGLVPIFVPSGANTGIKLSEPFEVPEGTLVDVVIDFDLRRSLRVPTAFDGTCYFLRPSYRVEVTATTGIIEGTVDAALLGANDEMMCSDDDPTTGNAVYVYEGLDRIPGDEDAVDDDSADPYATAQVSYDPDFNAGEGRGEFTVPFLSAGDYTVAFTCNADLERLPDPEADTEDERLGDDDLNFQQPQNATVEVQTTTVVDFTGQEGSPL